MVHSQSGVCHAQSPGHQGKPPCTTAARLICVRGWHQTMRDCYQMISLTPASRFRLYLVGSVKVMGRAVGTASGEAWTVPKL